MSASPVRDAPPAWILCDADAHVRIWGLTPEERLRRSLERAGCSPIERVSTRDRPKAPRAASVLVVRGDVILDERLITSLAAHRGVVLVAPEIGPVAAHADTERIDALIELLTTGRAAAGLEDLSRRRPDQMVSGYLANLRKWEPAYALRARPEDAREVEARTFDASYKDVTDLVTKWIWPRPARVATRLCARAGIQPNSVTAASWLLAIAAAGLFAIGWFGTGLAAAWLMTFLDTVDGKLARVTLTSSRLGDVMDHGLDLIHPPFWYAAWGLGLTGEHGVATAIAVLGYFIGRLEEGLFLAAFKLEIHSWRPIDALFRTITARRNPNLILLSVGALGGRPDLGMVMVAIWTLCSLAFHAVRLLQAFACRRRGQVVAAWQPMLGAVETEHGAGPPAMQR
jgi:phosphatidylglycerophosphate synthase